MLGYVVRGQLLLHPACRLVRNLINLNVEVLLYLLVTELKILLINLLRIILRPIV